MDDKRPKDMTEAERESLPVGPMQRDSSGRLVRLETRAVYWMNDDLLAWTDGAGRAWMFGQFRDGPWFKRPSSI